MALKYQLFQLKIIFDIFAENIDCGCCEAVLTSTHNVCFGNKKKRTTNFHMLLGLENEPPPPGVDGEEKKRKEEDMEDGETKEEKNGENSYRNIYNVIYLSHVMRKCKKQRCRSPLQ